MADRLFWVADDKDPTYHEKALFFNVDDQLVYFALNKDFGPLNLSMVHKFCKELESLLKLDANLHTRIFHYTTSEDPKKLSNACFLICAFQLIILKMSAKEAYSKFDDFQMKPYCDASEKDYKYYSCTVLHCL